ncbi:hypothetical protein PVK06_011200 [Gossypium arboreum]|uniref:Uncharacterized protein n=1 Tax=Gossypium arboreum TaxID=29729 RepID=A0ABR0Q879_GOSAR|nr:hypothetical protein PVK06_011200 [Gossypium arboreum]
MKPEEDINEMSDRFTIIINGLKSYGKTYPKEELVRKMRLNKRVEEEKVMKKNVGIALKSTTNEDSESNEEVNEDEEMEMFTGRFKRFMKSNKG